MKPINNYIQERLTTNRNKVTDYRSYRQQMTCAFNKYDDVTQDMVDRFWSDEEYAKNLIAYSDIRDQFKPVYEIAKKNVAMLDYAMHSNYTVYFDEEANLFIEINHGNSWSAQNHLHHYADKCAKYFKLQTSANSTLDSDKWELLFDGKRQ